MHRLLVVGLATVAALAWSGSALAWSWPAEGDVLKPFVLGSDAYAAGQHRGIDVAGVEGSPVVAPASGVIGFAGSLPTYGRGVTVVTSDGYAVTLVHLGSISVAKGDTIEEGRPVGTMGWSGDAEHGVPSVHLGIRIAAQAEGYVDPLGLLPARQKAPTAPPAPAPAPTPAPTPAAPPVSPPAQPFPQPEPATSATSPTPVPTSSSTPGQPQPEGDAGGSAPMAAPVASQATPSPVPFRIRGARHAPNPQVGMTPPGPGRDPAAAADVASPSPDASVEGVIRASGRSSASARAAIAAPTSPSNASPQTNARGSEVSMAAVRQGVADDAGASTGVGRSGRRVRPQANISTATARVPIGLGALRSAPPVEARARAQILPHDGEGVGLGVLAAGSALLLLALGAAAKAARRIGFDGAVLRHHADLLRQLDAAHRPRIHDRRGGRVRSSSAAARS